MLIIRTGVPTDLNICSGETFPIDHKSVSLIASSVPTEVQKKLENELYFIGIEANIAHKIKVFIKHLFSCNDTSLLQSCIYIPKILMVMLGVQIQALPSTHKQC
jgi:hypothetical protein